MLRTIQNLPISTKLWTASMFSGGMVALMVLTQWDANTQLRNANEAVVIQEAAARAATNARAGIRSMTLGVRDIRLARSSEELDKALVSLESALSSVEKASSEYQNRSSSTEGRMQIRQAQELASQYEKGAKEIARNRLEAIRILGGPLHDQDRARLSKLDDDAARYAREVTLPLADRSLSVAASSAELATQQATEIRKSLADRMTAYQFYFSLFAAGAGVALALTCIFLTITISRPIRDLSRSMLALADGNFEVVLPGLGRKDEVGSIAAAVENFKNKAREKSEREAAEKSAQSEATANRRQQEMDALAENFDTTVGEIIKVVSAASLELEGAAGDLKQAASRSSESTNVVAETTRNSSTDVQSVACATEELESSISEIGRQVQHSSRMAKEASDSARKTNESVNTLSQATSRIGDVVDLIKNVAAQTNLLALNATIEAARAGDAGRGFAVVAAEVKALASQTTRASDEIILQIEGIKSATDDSVRAIQQIAVTVEGLSEISSAIAAAVEEQGAATKEIARSVQRVATGAEQVSLHMAGLQRDSEQTGSASAEVFSAAQGLSANGERLQKEVKRFVDSVRAA